MPFGTPPNSHPKPFAPLRAFTENFDFAQHRLAEVVTDVKLSLSTRPGFGELQTHVYGFWKGIRKCPSICR